MYAELNNINTKGLVNQEDNAIELLEEVYSNFFYDSGINNDILSTIKDTTYDYDYKNVDEVLKSFIGVYKLNTNKIKAQKTKKLLFELYQYLIDARAHGFNSDISLYDGYIIKNLEKYDEFLTVIESKKYNEQSEVLQKGMILDSHNREIKALKWIRKELKQIIDIEDSVIESKWWYKNYTNENHSKDYYLVITNSQSSILGMSSYQNEKTNGEKAWCSCQTIKRNHEYYAKGTLCTMTDMGSIIMYITDGTTTYFEGLSKNKFKHQTMNYRYMLRLLKDSQKQYIVIDRGYPEKAFLEQVMEIVANICRNIGIDFSIFYNYNDTQNSGVNENYNKYILNSIDTLCVNSSYKITATENEPRLKDCSDCDNWINFDYNCDNNCLKCDYNCANYCGNCPTPCTNGNCAECSGCYDFEDVYIGHYDDNSIDRGLQADCELYERKYRIIHPRQITLNNVNKEDSNNEQANTEIPQNNIGSIAI